MYAERLYIIGYIIGYIYIPHTMPPPRPRGRFPPPGPNGSGGSSQGPGWPQALTAGAAPGPNGPGILIQNETHRLGSAGCNLKRYGDKRNNKNTTGPTKLAGNTTVNKTVPGRGGLLMHFALSKAKECSKQHSKQSGTNTGKQSVTSRQLTSQQQHR